MKLMHRKDMVIVRRWTEKEGDDEVTRDESTRHKTINAAKRESRRLQAAGWKWELFA